MQTKLYRSRSNVMLGGVCAGLGEYLNLDATIVRIFFIILALAGGPGFLVYLILWIVIPKEPMPGEVEEGEFNFNRRAGQMGQELSQAFSRPNPNTIKFIGAGMVLAGLFYLLQSFNFPWMAWLDRRFTWPAFIILVGVLLLVRAIRQDREN